MKLTKVAVKNFRSYVVGQNEKVPTLLVGDGLNLLVGANNCGKSNLLRAISLALDPKAAERFDIRSDQPAQLTWAFPTITLSFKCDPNVSVERTLLRYAREFEQSANASTPHADNNEVHFRVTYSKSGRDETFLARGAGNRRGEPAVLEKLLPQFHKSFRFIYLKSGESLGNFLVGTFRELLHTVLRDHLKDHIDKANRLRDDYIAGVANELLTPLGEHAFDQVSEVMNEITGLEIVPHVPPLNETLARSDMWLTDSADTALLNKGTGVRGALLVAVLSYLASNSRRSLILAVEEPESFLHPGAQQELRNDLVDLARRSDLSLLVTTHSPFLLDRSESTSITPFRKLPDGRTEIGDTIRGNERHAPTIRGLFGETITPIALELIEPLKSDAQAVLFVEGYTDKYYLEKAAALNGTPELLGGLDIRFGDGAFKAALEALLLRQMSNDEVPMAVVFDWDVMGKSAHDLLKQKFKWPSNRIFTYRNWRAEPRADAPIEAEDMFPASLLSAFVRKYGDEVVEEKTRLSPTAFHYGFSVAAKEWFMEFLEAELKPTHVSKWIDILTDVRTKLGL